MRTKLLTLWVAIALNQCFQVTSGIVDYIDCREEVGVTDMEIARFMLDLELAESNPKLKCYSACFMEAEGRMDGCTFLYEKNKQIAKETEHDELDMVIETCKDSVTSDGRCECGYEVHKCFKKFSERCETVAGLSETMY